MDTTKRSLAGLSRLLCLLLLLALCLSAAGCGRRKGAAEDAQPPAQTAAAPTAVPTVAIGGREIEVTAADIDMDFLLDERIRELVGEESRRFTLVRTGKYVERVRKYNAAIADKVNENHALWPIPQAILDANREGEFPQNPGYEN